MAEPVWDFCASRELGGAGSPTGCVGVVVVRWASHAEDLVVAPRLWQFLHKKAYARAARGTDGSFGVA